MLVYIWSRRNPYVRMNFFGLMNFQAPYLPWVLLGFSLMLGNSVVVDLMGKISSCCVKLDLGLFIIPRRSNFLLANDRFFTRSYKFIRLNGRWEWKVLWPVFAPKQIVVKSLKLEIFETSKYSVDQGCTLKAHITSLLLFSRLQLSIYTFCTAI